MSGEQGERDQVWRERLSCHAESGLTVAEFCETIGVSTAAFYQWRKRLSVSPSEHAAATDLFVPVALRESGQQLLSLELAHAVSVQIPGTTSEERLTTIFRAAILAMESATC